MSGAQLMRVNQGDRHRGIDGKHRRNVEPRSWLLCRTADCPRERADALRVDEDAALA